MTFYLTATKGSLRLRMRYLWVATMLLLNAGPSTAALNAPPAKETEVLQRVLVAGTDRELGLGVAEFPPNSAKPRQKATGPEVCYVLEGEVTVRIEGRPPQIFRAGQTFRLPANVVHQTSAGPHGAKVLASWVHTPGKQFNIPAPDRTQLGEKLRT